MQLSSFKLQSFGQSLPPFPRSVYQKLLREHVTEEMHKHTARLIDLSLGFVLHAGIGVSSDALLGAMNFMMQSFAAAVSDLCSNWNDSSSAGIYNLRIAICDRRYIKVFTGSNFYDTLEHKMVDRQVIPVEIVSYSVTKIYAQLLQSDNQQKRQEAAATAQPNSADGPTEPPVQKAPAE